MTRIAPEAFGKHSVDRRSANAESGRNRAGRFPAGLHAAGEIGLWLIERLRTPDVLPPRTPRLACGFAAFSGQLPARAQGSRVHRPPKENPMLLIWKSPRTGRIPRDWRACSVTHSTLQCRSLPTRRMVQTAMAAVANERTGSASSDGVAESRVFSRYWPPPNSAKRALAATAACATGSGQVTVRLQRYCVGHRVEGLQTRVFGSPSSVPPIGAMADAGALDDSLVSAQMARPTATTATSRAAGASQAWQCWRWFLLRAAKLSTGDRLAFLAFHLMPAFLATSRARLTRFAGQSHHRRQFVKFGDALRSFSAKLDRFPAANPGRP
jgi:hypothetical protein